MGLVHVETIPILNDVRMHGFEQHAKVETVLAWIDPHALPLANPGRTRIPHR